jgi:hypothetical protein
VREKLLLYSFPAAKPVSRGRPKTPVGIELAAPVFRSDDNDIENCYALHAIDTSIVRSEISLLTAFHEPILPAVAFGVLCGKIR